MIDYTLEKSVFSDKEQIELLFLQMLRSVYAKEDVEGYEEGYLDKFYQGSGDWICAARKDNQVIGYLSIELHREKENFLYLDDLCVDEAVRDQGIGTSLLRRAESYAREMGIHSLYLHVEQENTRAFLLYQRLGYRIAAAEGSRYRMKLDV